VAILSHNAGQDCMSCHRAGGAGASRGIFTVAGTVYRNGGTAQTMATVMIYPQGSNTAQATMTVDGLGNFWTTQTVAALVPAAGQTLVQGVRAVVQPVGGTSRAMLGVISNGSCNSCHSPGGGVARVTAQLQDSGMMRAAATSTGESLAQESAPVSTIVPVQIATGAAHACVVKSDGGVLCWGSNAAGQLGANVDGDQSAPVTATVLGHVSLSTDDLAIAAGSNHTCGVAATGNLVLCWGADDRGQLGNGDNTSSQISVIALSGVNALSAADDSTCARVGTGDAASFYCWGANSNAPRRVAADAADRPDALVALLDDGTPLLAATTVGNVAGLGAVSFTRIASGAARSCGITTTHRVKCWEGTHASVDIPLP
jgi:hypothetical protein